MFNLNSRLNKLNAEFIFLIIIPNLAREAQACF